VEEAMLDVFVYALFVLVMIGLLRHVMHGIEPQNTTSEGPKQEP